MFKCSSSFESATIDYTLSGTSSDSYTLLNSKVTISKAVSVSTDTEAKPIPAAIVLNTTASTPTNSVFKVTCPQKGIIYFHSILKGGTHPDKI
ncbi:MAG: hypothetical protein QF704_01780 [Anaerolineales bacterium]|nr:hypothetical protein [Anaerolineales bacterium]